MTSVAVEPFASEGWREMVRLRHDVLRAPLGLAFAPDELDREGDDQHLALRVDGVLVGTLLIRLAPPGTAGPAKFRQMAVRATHRGQGLGGVLLSAGERHAATSGAGRGVLHARLAATGFYERAGWTAEGATFVEVTLPHLRMRKALAVA